MDRREEKICISTEIWNLILSIYETIKQIAENNFSNVFHDFSSKEFNLDEIKKSIVLYIQYVIRIIGFDPFFYIEIPSEKSFEFAEVDPDTLRKKHWVWFEDGWVLQISEEEEEQTINSLEDIVKEINKIFAGILKALKFNGYIKIAEHFKSKDPNFDIEEFLKKAKEIHHRIYDPEVVRKVIDCKNIPEAIKILIEIFNKIRENFPFLDRREEKTIIFFENFIKIISELSAEKIVELFAYSGFYTFIHSLNMANAIAQFFELVDFIPKEILNEFRKELEGFGIKNISDELAIEILKLGIRFHDIGKDSFLISIIILIQGGIVNEERNLVKLHSLFGYIFSKKSINKIIEEHFKKLNLSEEARQNLPGILNFFASVTISHHSAYYGLDHPTPSSQIITIFDVLDSVFSGMRPYVEKKDERGAVEFLGTLQEKFPENSIARKIIFAFQKDDCQLIREIFYRSNQQQPA